MIPEAIARLLASVPAELVSSIYDLIRSALSSPDPKRAIERAAKALAADTAADEAVDELFDAAKHVPNRGL